MVAAGLFLGIAVPTAASAAYTTGDVNLRTGPGTGYAVITTAPAGSFVNVLGCPSSWCRVNFRGIVGWMSAGYIGSAPRYYPPKVYYPPRAYPRYYPQPYYYPRPYPYPRYYYPRAYPGYRFGYRGPDWGFSIYGR
jgi:hypothetical protein